VAVGSVAVAVTENVALAPSLTDAALGWAEMVIVGYDPKSYGSEIPPPPAPISTIVPAVFLM
jgi:hypothetical protein